MYLEISGRRTGKTTRLLLEVQKHVSDGGTAVVVSPTQAMGKHMFNELMPYFRNRTDKIFFVSAHASAPGALQLCGNMDKPGWRFFYDEFDFVEGADNYPEFPFDTGGYYCTSPKKLRELKSLLDHNKAHQDLLLRLLTINRLTYTRHINENCLNDYDTRMRDKGDPDDVRAFYLRQGEVFESEEILNKIGQAQLRFLEQAARAVPEDDDEPACECCR